MSAGKATQGLPCWFCFSSGCALPLMRANTPGPRASMSSIRLGLRGPRALRLEALSLGQGQLVLLGSASVDVFPIHSIFHEGNVVIRRQGEVRDAAHEASHVLPAGVQSDFLHSTHI